MGYEAARKVHDNGSFL